MDLSLLQMVLLTCVGVMAGWLNVMAGGGSMLTVPVMVFMGMPGPIANGTNRIAILAQNISATLTFFNRGFRELKLGLSLAAAAIPGAAIGALIGVRLEGEVFDRVLAIIMIGMMILMLTEKKQQQKDSQQTQLNSQRLFWGHICMFGVGLWGGFIQIGVGFILMPVLHRVLGLDLVRVNAIKVFVILCYTFVALIIFAKNVEIFWIAGLSLAAGNAIGGWLGARTTITKGEKLIRWVLNTVLVLFILKLLFF